jgi:hypothetical protein
MRQLTKQFKLQKAHFEFLVEKAFYNALKENSEVNADTVFYSAVKLEVPVKIICAVLPNLFRRYRKANLIKKTGRFALSERSSTPLPLYTSNLYAKVPGKNPC